jgi:hypothetical protein
MATPKIPTKNPRRSMVSMISEADSSVSEKFVSIGAIVRYEAAEAYDPSFWKALCVWRKHAVRL